LLALVPLIALSVATAPVAVAGQRIHVTGVVVGGGLSSFGQVNRTARCDPPTECVEHLSGFETFEFVEGSPYLEGIANYHLDIVYHESCDPFAYCEVIGGSIHNTFKWDIGSEGGWTGTGAGVITGFGTGGFVYHGTSTASGWGDLAGWHLQVSKWVDPATGVEFYDGWVTQTGI